MSAGKKDKILALVADSGLPRWRALAQLGLPKSTCYRCLRRQTEGRLQDMKGGSHTPWNKLGPEEVERILAQARKLPDLSARVACSIVISASSSESRAKKPFSTFPLQLNQLTEGEGGEKQLSHRPKSVWGLTASVSP